MWEQSYLGLLSKDQKFILVFKRVDTVAKCEDFEQFARKLRLKLCFATCSIASDNTLSEDFEQEKEPWKQKSDFPPCPHESQALQNFFTELQIFLLNPNKFKDNLSADEREML